MAQEFLHVAQRGAVLEQVRGEAVAQRVGRDFRVNAGLFGGGFEDVPDPLAGQALAAVVDVERGFAFLVGDHFGPRAADVFAQVGQGFGIHIYDALLGALAPGADEALFKVDVLHVEGNQLADPDAGGVEQFQDAGVAAAFRSAGIGGGAEQQFHVVFGNELGHGAPHSRRTQSLGGVFADQFVGAQVAEEGADGGHFAGDR